MKSTSASRRPVWRRRGPVLIAAAAVLAAAGIAAAATAGGGSPKGSPGGAAAASAAPNPVEILRKVPGCVLPGGAAVGDHDADGDRMADCAFLDNGGTEGTSLTVYTNSERPDFGFTTDDSHKYVYGDRFVLTITGDWGSYSAHVDPAQIAAEVGGSLTP